MPNAKRWIYVATLVGTYLTSTLAEAKLPINGRPINGRPINGRPINGRPINGRPINGSSPDAMAGGMIYGSRDAFERTFKTPWTTAGFDGEYDFFNMLLCNQDDLTEIKYIYGLAASERDVLTFKADCKRDGTTEQITLRGSLGYAPSLLSGEFLDPVNEPDRLKLTNVLMAVTNGALDPFGNIIHNQLRVSSAFDPYSTPRAEPVDFYRGTAVNVRSIYQTCASTVSRTITALGTFAATTAATATADPDCGYQVNGGVVFRVGSSTANIRVTMAGLPASVSTRGVVARISRGYEAGDHVSGSPLTTAGTTKYAVKLTGSKLTATLSGLPKGLYNITWSPVSPSRDLTTSTDWSSFSLSVAATSGTISTSDLDTINLREAVFYSRNGGVFNYDNLDSNLQTCEAHGEWASGDNGPYVRVSHVMWDGASWVSCDRTALGQPMFGFNVIQAMDFFWASGLVDLFAARSCSSGFNTCVTALPPWLALASISPELSASGTWPATTTDWARFADYTTPTVPYWSLRVNQTFDPNTSRDTGAFTGGYFSDDWSYDYDYAVTTFLTDACARSSTTLTSVWSNGAVSPPAGSQHCSMFNAPNSTY